MGLFDILNKINGSKGPEASDEETVKKKNRAQTSQYRDYIKTNLVRVCKLLDDLRNETQGLVRHITSMKGIKMSFKEKGELRKIKEKATKNLQYLYLSRDFFSALSKNASGIALQNEELGLVTKFAPFFDGVPVLDVEDAEDTSVLGAFKEVGQELMSTFISSKKSVNSFDFEDYLCRYEEQLDEYIIPKLDSAIESFKRATSTEEGAVTGATQTEAAFCSCCGAKISSESVGECEYCGASLN